MLLRKARVLLRNKNLCKNLPCFRFSGQSQNENQNSSENEQKPSGVFSSQFLTSLLGGGIVVMLGYGIYKEYLKGPSDQTDLGSEIPQGEISSSLLNVIDRYGKNSREAAIAFKEEGQRLYALGKNEQSVNFLQKSLQIYSKLKETETEEVANLYRDIGYNLLKMAKVKEARESMKKASDIHFNLKQFEQSFDELEAVALTYADSFESGKELFNQIIQKRKENIGDNDPMLARTYIRYAMLYSTQRMREDVLDCLKQAFGLMKIHKIPKEKTSSLYQELSLVYHNIHAFNEAINATQTAIENLDRRTDAAKIAQLTKQLGALYSLLKNPLKSIETFKLYIDQIKLMEGHELDLGISYRKIAEEYEKMNNFNEAIEYWNKFVEVFGRQNQSEQAIAGKMQACYLYIKSKRREKAIDCFEDCFMLANRDLGQDHKVTQSTFEVLRALK